MPTSRNARRPFRSKKNRPRLERLGHPDASASTSVDPKSPSPDHSPATVDPPPYFLFSDRAIKPIEWLWPGMIPMGKVTLLIGDPGIGKSLLAVDLAARLTRGEGIPPDGQPREPARVLFIAGDGETEDILPERLDRYGAVMSRVAGIEAETGFGGRESGDRGEGSGIRKRGASRAESRGLNAGSFFFSLAHDVDLIHEALHALPGCRLVVIDPVSEFLEGVDANSNMDVRRLLTRLGGSRGRIGRLCW